MNLTLSRRDILGKIEGLVDELDQLIARIQLVFENEHNPQTGAHADVTADSVTTPILDLTGTSQTTVGAAGGATALPATPTGYTPVLIDGVEYVIPYYAKA